MQARRCRIAILGFGTVGSAVARRLVDSAAPTGFSLTHVLDRRAALKRTLHPELAGVRWTTAIDDVLASDVDVIVEAIGGFEPARAWIASALAAGKSVVTANKRVIARDALPLLRLAERQGRQLRFEAAVGGAMPIVRALGEGLAGDRITRIAGILNGTTNAVLSQIEATGCSGESALAAARSSGLAEADPAADLDGEDASAKLAILCALAFGVRIDPSRIPRRSCAAVGPADFAAAHRQGATIRQLASAEYDYTQTVLTAWVGPTLVPLDSLFARTAGPANAAIVTAQHCGETGMFGIGAGGDATAVAVLSDIAAIARDRAAVIPAPRLTSDFSLQRSAVGFQLSDGSVQLSAFSCQPSAIGLQLQTSDFRLQTSSFAGEAV